MTTVLIGYLLSVRHFGRATARQVAQRRGLSIGAARLNLAQLVRLGLLDTVEGTGHPRQYVLTEEGEIAAAAALRGTKEGNE